MLGLALLACALAETRTDGSLAAYFNGGCWGPVQRHAAQSTRAYAASREYYAIIDRISRGERP